MGFFTKKRDKREYGNKRAKIISIAAQKGGVGKTTISTNLAVAQALFSDKKVLLIDLDAQAHTYEALFSFIEREDSLFSEYFLDKDRNLMDIVKETDIENFYYIPADKKLIETESRIASKIGKEFIFKKLLDIPKTHFDLIIIDSPPNLGPLTISALVASDYVVIPTELSNLSMDGIDGLLETMELVIENYNHKLDILGIIINKIDLRATKTNKFLIKELEERFSDYLRTPYIPNSTLFKKAQLDGKSIFEYDKKHKVTKLFKDLSKSLI